MSIRVCTGQAETGDGFGSGALPCCSGFGKGRMRYGRGNQ